MDDQLEARVRRLEDLAAINQLFVDYIQYLDWFETDKLVELFTEDGEVLYGPGNHCHGRDEIAAFLRRLQGGGKPGGGFHIVSNPRIVLDGDTATADVVWTVIGMDADGQPKVSTMGAHKDELVRDTDGQWRFKRRKGRMYIPNAIPDRARGDR